MNALHTAPSPLQRLRTPAGFVCVALACYLIDGLLARSATFSLRPDLFAPAIGIDLTIGITAAYWMLVVRPAHARPRTALAVFLTAVAMAAFVLPGGHRDMVRYIRYLGVPFELAAVVLVVLGVRRARRGLASAEIELDVHERVSTVLAAAMPYRWAANALATEVSVAYYAFGAWRRAPFVERGADAFSYHRRTAYAAILYTLVFASLVEVAAVHFVLRAIAPRLSLAVLALSVFGAVWLLGFARSVQLRPITVSDDLLRVRNGLRWSLDIPRATIARIDVGRIRTPAKGTAGYLCAGFGQPNVLIELGAPVVARGPYGTTRSVTHLSFVVDDPARFSATFV